MIALRNTQNEQDQKVLTYVENYNGNFDFLVSLKAQLIVKGYLSDKQLAAAERCMNREQQPKQSPIQPVARTFSIKPGQVLEVSKGFAAKIAEKNGSQHTFFNFEVLEIKAETAKAILVRTKASAKVTSQCCVCGRSLTDPASILSGIGPVCADNTGIPHGDVEVTKAALEALASKEVEVETWIPKVTIKNLDVLQGREYQV